MQFSLHYHARAVTIEATRLVSWSQPERHRPQLEYSKLCKGLLASELNNKRLLILSPAAATWYLKPPLAVWFRGP